MYTYVCIYICMYIIHIYTCICICFYVYIIYIYIYIHIHIYIYINIFIFTCIHIYIFLHTVARTTLLGFHFFLSFPVPLYFLDFLSSFSSSSPTLCPLLSFSTHKNTRRFGGCEWKSSPCKICKLDTKATLHCQAMRLDVCDAGCCSTLQYVAVRCSTLQYIAVYLQCVAICRLDAIVSFSEESYADSLHFRRILCR